MRCDIAPKVFQTPKRTLLLLMMPMIHYLLYHCFYRIINHVKPSSHKVSFKISKMQIGKGPIISRPKRSHHLRFSFLALAPCPHTNPLYLSLSHSYLRMSNVCVTSSSHILTASLLSLPTPILLPPFFTHTIPLSFSLLLTHTQVHPLSLTQVPCERYAVNKKKWNKKKKCNPAEYVAEVKRWGQNLSLDFILYKLLFSSSTFYCSQKVGSRNKKEIFKRTQLDSIKMIHE